MKSAAAAVCDAFINIHSKEQHHAILWRQERMQVSLRGARRVSLHAKSRDQKKTITRDSADPESYIAASRASILPD
jgi:hypothetical protein